MHDRSSGLPRSLVNASTSLLKIPKTSLYRADVPSHPELEAAIVGSRESQGKL
ncbi:MAG: hypothetical protein ACO31I_17210 [Prochlorotrichaceae cyanobacterium]